MKKLGLAIILVSALFSNQVLAFYGGNGSETNPFLISNCNELQSMVRNLSAHYKLASDIDCNDFNRENGGFYPVGNEKTPFTGKLDGNNKQIKKLNIERFNLLDVGLFGVTKDASITNLQLTAPKMKVAEGRARDTRAGFLVGQGIATASRFSEFSNIRISDGSLENGFAMGALIGKFSWQGQISKIFNIRVTDTVLNMDSGQGSEVAGGVIGLVSGSGQNRTCGECKISGVHLSGGKVRSFTSGGLFGTLEFEGTGQHGNLIIENSSANTSVESYVSGGLIGTASTKRLAGEGKLIIRQSWTKGKVLGLIAGGFIANCGKQDSPSGLPVIISQSYSTTDVSSHQISGGLAGTIGSDCFISDSYAQGEVQGNLYVGGLVGLAGVNNDQFQIERSYSIGEVKSGSLKFHSDFGGLIGATLNASKITDSYWDTQTSRRQQSAAGTGKSTLQMYQKSTYKNWDFDTIWEIEEGKNYPRLR